MRFRKLRKNIKAISPVLSVLMMIAIAVAASLVAYAWVMGYLSFTTEKVGKAIQIQSVANSGEDLLVYVQNVGDGAVELDPDAAVYVNGLLTPCTIDDEVLEEGETATLTVTDVNAGSGTAVKVQTSDGTFTEMTNYGDGSGGTPTPTPTPPQDLILRPTGTGNVEELDEDYSGLQNWECVEEVTSDGDSYFVYDGNSYNGWDTDTYATANHYTVSGTINSVTVYINCRRYGTASGTSYARTALRVGSTTYYGTSNALSGSYTQYSTTYTSNPGGGTWTWSDIDALQCGVSLDSADTSGYNEYQLNMARCTQVWVEVNYTP